MVVLVLAELSIGLTHISVSEGALMSTVEQECCLRLCPTSQLHLLLLRLEMEEGKGSEQPVRLKFALISGQIF